MDVLFFNTKYCVSSIGPYAIEQAESDKKKIKDLDFPRSAIIGGVIRDNIGLIPLGDFKIEMGDKVVVCCLPRSITQVERFFF